MKNTVFLVVFTAAFFPFVSCSVEKHILANNEISERQVTQGDTVIKDLKFIRNTIKQNTNSTQPPEIEVSKRINIDDFYYGNIIGEEVLDQKNDWIKIKIKEEIIVPNSKPILKERVGWFLFHTPSYIYPLANENTITILDGKDPIQPESMQKTMPNITAPKILTTEKSDALDQKSLDILLAAKSMNFDGFRFDNKRFDYANFSFGSFRGSFFNNCNLSNIKCKRDILTKETDFENTKFVSGTHLNAGYSFWKFKDVNFLNITIENSNFENCLFNSTNSAILFQNVTLKKVTFSNTNDGMFSATKFGNTKFENCRFIDVKMYGTINFNTEYISCSVIGGTWYGLGFNVSEAPSKILGGSFNNLTIIGGDYPSINILPYGTAPSFSGVTIVNANFSKATISAIMQDGCKFYGGGNFSNIDFSASYITNSEFGAETQQELFNMKNCKFENTITMQNVKFTKCDLTGSTWPANKSNIQFVDCKGALTN